MKCIKIKDSKYGSALVLETSAFSGSYNLGFRLPNEDEVFDQLSTLLDTFKLKPVFGVQYVFDDTETDISKVTIPRQEDNMEIMETGYEHVRSIQNTYAVSRKKN